MTASEILTLLGVLLTCFGMVVAGFYKVRTDLRDEVKEAKAEAKDARDKAIAAEQRSLLVELVMAKEYVSIVALREAIGTLRSEIKTGFEHVNEKFDMILGKNKDI